MTIQDAIRSLRTPQDPRSFGAADYLWEKYWILKAQSPVLAFEIRTALERWEKADDLGCTCQEIRENRGW